MSPKWNITYHDRSRIAPGYWFIAPYRFADNHLDDVKWTPCEVGPMIFDADGELVWSGACLFGNRISFDFGVVELRGESLLKGNLKHANFPEPNCGAGWFLNSKYEMEHSILFAKNVDDFNQHEFNVEEQGKRTMIITHGREHLDAVDLGVDGKVWVRTDGFRELDTETGDVVFDWRTQHHVSLNESTFRSPADADEPEAPDYSKSAAWDAFHANSATKNQDGDYLISIRHTDTLTLVSGKTGHIIWRCGGKLSDFAFERNAKFSRQHDARYIEQTAERSVISLMDNAIGDTSQDKQPATHEYSRGLILELSHKKGEPFVARMLKQFKRPDGGYGDRRGNLQILPNGNVFMAWTDAGFLSEHTDDGEVLMEAKWLRDDRFGTYRAYKNDRWIGEPSTLPDVKAFGYCSRDERSMVAVYVSWNGATEVQRWKFYAGGKLLGEKEKTGFESVFAASDVSSGKVQVEAFDSKGASLARSGQVDIEWTTGGTSAAESGDGDTADRESSLSGISLWISAAIFVVNAVAAAVGFWCMRWKSRRRPEEHMYEGIPLEEPVCLVQDTARSTP